MKKRLLEMEQESFPVNAENNADPNSEGGPTAQSVPKNAATARAADVNQPRSPIGGDDAVADADARSIYVGNVSCIPFFQRRLFLCEGANEEHVYHNVDIHETG